MSTLAKWKFIGSPEKETFSAAFSSNMSVPCGLWSPGCLWGPLPPETGQRSWVLLFPSLLPDALGVLSTLEINQHLHVPSAIRPMEWNESNIMFSSIPPQTSICLSTDSLSLARMIKPGELGHITGLYPHFLPLPFRLTLFPSPSTSFSF